MSRSVKTIQIILGAVAIALVFALFTAGMVRGTSRDEPASPNTPGPTTPATPEASDRMPGVPERPVSEHAKLEGISNADPDRQLDYEPKGKPSVSFADSLGSLKAYATQVVTWKPCDGSETSQCAKVRSPLDWDKPSGPAVEIAVRRVTNGDSSRGPLFVNPGGPGFGGQSLAESLAGRWKNYDTVGWDPRGTGDSTHVVCGDLAQTDAIQNLDASPDNQTEITALKDGGRDFAKQCRDASGKLLDHITTIDVVRDLDLLRHLLGAGKLNYVGVSYGTFVGSMYAELFPHSVGRLVLDAAVDITGSDDAPAQVEGFELAWENFAKWCASSKLCAIREDSRGKVDSKLKDFLAGLDSRPLPVGNRKLTQTHASTGIALFLYEDDTAYRTLAEVLAQAYSGDGSSLLRAADYYNGRQESGYETQTYAFPAMACADSQDDGAAPVISEWKSVFPKAPIMAPNMGTSYTCQFWTAKSAPQLKITADGAPTILVVGTTGDSATPYAQAQSMSKQLSSGTLLTLDGAGHGAVTGDNSCIAEHVDAYLYDGTAPPEGTVCKQ